MLNVDCGCYFKEEGAALRKAFWCEDHASSRQAPETLGIEYYRDLGVMGADPPHVQELTSTLGHVDMDSRVVEVGSGASPYQEYLQNRGCSYYCVDPSAAAVEHNRKRGGGGHVGRCEDELPKADVVLAAHVLEHVESITDSLQSIRKSLEPSGLLYAIVPNGRDDPGNPDHTYCFTPGSLATVLEEHGFDVLRLHQRRIVEHERFMYALAALG